MKKSILSLVALAATLSMAAEGYQVNSLSAKQEGMAHVGTGLKLGAESMIFNPAGMAFMDKSLDLTAKVSIIKSNVKATVNGKEYETSNDPSTPFAINAAFSIYDNLKAGITINTPYGSGMDWSNNWAGSMLNQSVKLSIFNVQPTVSYRILPNLSVGAGMMITWGNVDLNKGLVDPATLDKALALQAQAMGQPAPEAFGETAPASVNLKGNAEIALGYNVGIMWDITDQITVGASYRSKMDMKVKSGDAKLTYANALAENALGTLVGLNGANFKASMPAVSILSFGISYRPIEKLTIAFDAQMTGWSAYDKLNIEFLDDKLSAFNQNITKNYSDSWAYRLGAQYALTNRFDVRAGCYIDTTPVDDNHYNPETPGMTRVCPSVGFSFRPIERVSIDLAFTYVAGLGADNKNCNYDDLVAAQQYAQNPQLAQLNVFGPVQKTFTADYKLNALIPAIGVSYSF